MDSSSKLGCKICGPEFKKLSCKLKQSELWEIQDSCLTPFPALTTPIFLFNGLKLSYKANAPIKKGGEGGIKNVLFTWLCVVKVRVILGKIVFL